jgi:hypothetical protein
VITWYQTQCLQRRSNCSGIIMNFAPRDECWSSRGSDGLTNEANSRGRIGRLFKTRNHRALGQRALDRRLARLAGISERTGEIVGGTHGDTLKLVPSATKNEIQAISARETVLNRPVWHKL